MPHRIAAAAAVALVLGTGAGTSPGDSATTSGVTPGVTPANPAGAETSPGTAGPKVEATGDEAVRLGPLRGFRLSDLEWKDGPFPGSRIALLAGDPRTGIHHTYLRLADGARVGPHWHSTDEYATVVSGTVLFAHGEDFDPKAARLFGPGSFLFIPARAPHYAWAKGEVVLSQTRTGAADIHWVHPEDDPARATKPAR